MNRKKVILQFVVSILAVFILTNCSKPIESDNELPIVTILQPENGETITEPIMIQAEATDNEGISKVEFYVDSLLIETVEEPIYEAYFNPFYYSDGNDHSIIVKAIDINENESIPSEIQITIPAGLENFPELIQPQNNEFILNGTEIQFIWHSFLDASSYNFQLSNDFEFNNIIHEASLFDTLYSFIPEETGNLFWRIQALDEFSNPSNWSIISSFQYDDVRFFKKVYNPIDYCFIKKTIQLEDCSYFSLGLFAISSTNIRTVILKTDKIGNQQWVRFYDDKSWHMSSDMVQLDDEYFVATGYSDQDTLTYPRNMLLAKIDSFGEIIWEKIYESESPNRATALTKTNDGGFAIIGVQNGDSFYDHTRVVKTDATGNFQWEFISSGGSQVGYDIIQTDTDELIIIGEKKNNPYSDNTNLIINKLDINGQLIWTSTLYGPPGDDIRSGYIEKSDNGYVIVGRNINDTYMIEIDSEGQLLWNKEFDFARRDNVLSINKTSDNCFILSGWYDIGWYDDPILWITKVDNLGTKLWLKPYRQDDRSMGYSATQCSDGGFIIGGLAGSQRKMLLIKTDENGNLPDNMKSHDY